MSADSSSQCVWCLHLHCGKSARQIGKGKILQKIVMYTVLYSRSIDYGSESKPFLFGADPGVSRIQLRILIRAYLFRHIHDLSSV
jgi:hypothetical protein